MSAGQVLKRLARIAADRYRPSGRFAHYFARGKLGRDPVFAALLARGLIPEDARLLDLGCGQGLLAAWLEAARASHREGQWPESWPPPPRLRSFRGIELMPRDVERARQALGALAQIECADIRSAAYGEVDVVIVLDVLHYLDPSAQEQVLQRVRASIGPAGILLLRVGNAAGGWRFKVSLWVDAAVLSLRGHGRRRLYCHTLPAWSAILTSCGFSARAIPMSEGTPFANVLLVATPQ
ncbi:MAG TPA: methyltransferase domain-containing protein [Steroidobacteraceae bacterium]|nr:methyltransferase domain-containing protein [Steroidobacteraceae bacterium]